MCNLWLEITFSRRQSRYLYFISLPFVFRFCFVFRLFEYSTLRIKKQYFCSTFLTYFLQQSSFPPLLFSSSYVVVFLTHALFSVHFSPYSRCQKIIKNLSKKVLTQAVWSVIIILAFE